MSAVQRLRWVACVILLQVLAAGPARSQGARQSLAQVLSTRRLAEHADRARSSIQLRLVDERRFQENAVNMAALDSSLRGRLTRDLRGETFVEGSPVLSVRVRLAYMGFDRTEGGNWIARGTAGILIVDETAARRTVFDADVTVDEVIGRRRPSGSSNPAGTRLINELTNGIMAKIAGADSSVGSGYRQVTAVGTTPSTTMSDAAVNRATIDALRAACAKAWGVEVEAVTRIVDLTDVTTRTDARSRGLVRSFTRRDQETVLTSDGHLVVTVDAIVAMPPN